MILKPKEFLDSSSQKCRLLTYFNIFLGILIFYMIIKSFWKFNRIWIVNMCIKKFIFLLI